MDYEELRPLVLESLKQKNSTQFVELLNDVEKLALKKGFYNGFSTWSSSAQVTEHKMPREDREKVRELINSLIIQEIIGWGIDENNPYPPWIKVTKYGKECIDKGAPQPHDPDGYLKYLSAEINSIDDVILIYIKESLQAYLRGLMFSSTVMLGCASEKAIILLLDSYLNSLSDLTEKQKIENKLNNAPIKQKMVFLRKQFEILKSSKKLTGKNAYDIETQLDGIFNFIRTCRNDVGHPTGRDIDRNLAYANLRIFVPYCKKVYDLIDFFSNNKI